MNIALLPGIAVLFLLVFARMGSIVMLMPAIGESAIPTRQRLVLALAVTFVLYPAVVRLYPQDLANDPARLGVFLAGEIATGLFIGLAARMVMAATQVAGTTIANQLGLGFAMAVDPAQGQQGVVVGNFIGVVAITLVFVADLHHLAIMGLSNSYGLFRPGDWMPVGDFAEAAVKLTAESFKVGVQISAPFLAFGLVFSLALGVLAKLMPQFQIFFIAMPLNIIAGFALLALVVGSIMLWYMDHVRDGFGRLFGA
jgi:flagellar biosynthetic protein FliR